MKFTKSINGLVSDSKKTAFIELITTSQGIGVNYATQRPYVWSSKEINQLLDDLYDAYLDYTKDGLTKYYLHHIILSNYDNHETNARIVDGQQRITTMTLLAHYLIQKMNDGASHKSWLKSSMLGDYSFKIEGFDFDNDNFIKVSKKKKTEDVVDEDEDSNKSLTCLNAVSLINEYFDNLTDVNFTGFFTWMMKNTFIIVQELLDESKELALFIDINSKGKSVSTVDKIKNILIDRIENVTNRSIIEAKWKIFDKKFNQLINKGYKQKSANAGDVKETIFRDIYKITKAKKYKEYQKSTMFEDFIERYDTYEETLKLIDYAIMYVDDMINYLYSPKPKYKTPTLFLRQLKIKSFFTTILYAKEYGVDVDFCLEILSRIVLFNVTNNKTYKFNTLDNFQALIKKGDTTNIIEWYNNFVTIQSDVDLLSQFKYTGRNTRIQSVLVFMEANMRNGNYLKRIEDEKLFTKFNIEHICAKGGKIDKNSWMNGFGNLTLLHGSKNSSLQDRMSLKPGSYLECVNENVLSKMIATTNPDDFSTIPGTNKKYLGITTPYTAVEIVNWDETLSNKRGFEAVKLFKEMIKL